MRFKPPGFYLGFLSLFWIFGIGYLGYVSVQQGQQLLAAICSIYVVCSIPLWFNIRWFAIPLMILFSITTLASIYALFLPGPWMKAIGRLCIALSSVQALWEWYSAPEDEDSPSE